MLIPRYPPRILAEKTVARVRRGWRAATVARAPIRLDDARFRGLLVDSEPPSAFHLVPSRRAAYVEALHQRWPGEPARILAEAESIRRRDFELLSAPVALRPDRGFDWHRDPATAKRWPPEHFTRVDYLGLGDASDVKRLWELSRQQWLIPLGQAYWLTGDESWAEELLSQVDDWIGANPVEIGVNWTVAMEAALRLVSWGWAIHFVGGSPALTPERRRRWLESVYLHARYVGENLERTQRSGNHLLADALGLVYAGVAFPVFRDAPAWRARGWALLWSELERQVYPDGVDYEGSSSYHRMVLEFLLDARLLARRAGADVPARADERIDRMLAVSRALMGPEGLGPMIGDADDGFAWRFAPRHTDDHRPALALGGALPPGEPVPVEALWLLGPDTVASSEAEREGAAPPSDQAFPHGGLFVMRDAATQAVVDCGHLGMGPRGHGGHGHCDTLSLVLWANGRPLLVDPGTFTYTGDAQARRLFRSTAGHNALRVDGVEQADPTGPWSFDNRCDPLVHAWRTDDERAFFEGSHSGFERGPRPVRHRRQVELVRDRYWLIVDVLEGQGRHLVERFWHLAPGEARLEEGRLTSPNGVLAWEEGPLASHLEEGWVSRAYGQRERAPVLVQRGEVELPARLPLYVAARAELLPG